MKFACIMGTRGRALQASAVIESAKALASGHHEIRFIVCADDDDYETQDQFRRRYDLSVAPSPIGLGEVWNRGAVLAGDADIICPLPDDSFISVPDWDDLIADTFSNRPPHMRVMGWNDLANPGLLTLPIIGADWYKAAGLYPNWFPYWFYDTWVAEVFSFTTGYLPPLPEELRLAAKKGKTQRMRDLGFWWKFYSATRIDRLNEAERLREVFGLSFDGERLSAAHLYWEHRDRDLARRIQLMEEAMTDHLAQMPSERYLAAKSRAEEHLAQMAA